MRTDELTVPSSADRFAGRVAVVTGAGAGIGRALAGRLLDEGARVVAVDLRADRLDALAGARAGEPLDVVACDLCDPASAEALAARVAPWGGADVLCSNAGIIDRMAPAHRTDPADWERVMAVNVTAPYLLARALLPAMLDRGRGAIVTTASGAGLRGGASGAAYTTSKHAVIGLTRNLAWAYAARGIRANAVCPGAVATSINEGLPPRDPEDQAHWQPVVDLVPRVGTAEELAAVIAYLASDDASFVNGAVVAADGGWGAG